MPTPPSQIPPGIHLGAAGGARAGDGWMGAASPRCCEPLAMPGRTGSRDPPARAASLTASCGRIAGNGLDPQGNCVFQPIMAGEDVRHRSLEETSPGLGHRGMLGSWRCCGFWGGVLGVVGCAPGPIAPTSASMGWQLLEERPCHLRGVLTHP